MAQSPLRDALVALAAHDPRWALFGANQHGWQSRAVAPEAIDAFEREHGVSLPAGYRRWLVEVGVGAGPYYGLDPLPAGTDAPGGSFTPDTATAEPGTPIPGTVQLAHEGCGYFDLLVLTGPHAGEVWVDVREGGGPIARIYPTFEAWIAAWQLRCRAEWVAQVVAPDGVPDSADPAFVQACAADGERVLAGVDDPMLGQYPVPSDHLALGLGRIALARGDRAQAALMFERAAEASRDPSGVRAVGQCWLARLDGAEAWLAAADAGLGQPNLWFISTLRLLRERRWALEALERWDDAAQAVDALAEHDPNDVQAQLDVAWIAVLRGDAAKAAAAVHRCAERQRQPADQIASGLLDALVGAGEADGAAALRELLAAG